MRAIVRVIQCQREGERKRDEKREIERHREGTQTFEKVEREKRERKIKN